MMQRLHNSIGAVQNWIDSIVLVSSEPNGLAAECDTLIQSIHDPEAPTHFASYAKSVDFVAMIELTRDEMLTISSELTDAHISASFDSSLAAVYLAESFARSDDLQAVAVLLELCERVVNDKSHLVELWEFVLNQQCLDGSFGLISAELSMLGRGDEQELAKLTLTRDVLRAIRTRYQFGGQAIAAS